MGSTQEDLGVGFEDRLTSRSSSGAGLVNALHLLGGTGVHEQGGVDALCQTLTCLLSP